MHYLCNAFSIRFCSYNDSGFVVLQRSSQYLGRACSIPVYKNDHLEVLGAGFRIVNSFGSVLSVFTHDLACRKQIVRYLDARLSKSAAVISEIEDELCTASGLEILYCVLEFVIRTINER